MNISNSFKYLHTLIKSHKNNISQTDLYTKINLPFLKVFWALKNSDIFCLRGHFCSQKLGQLWGFQTSQNLVRYWAPRPVKILATYRPARPAKNEEIKLKPKTIRWKFFFSFQNDIFRDSWRYHFMYQDMVSSAVSALPSELFVKRN